MALGIRFGRTNALDVRARDRSYFKAELLLRRFEKKHGTLLCCHLIGINLRTPEGLEQLKRIRLEKCVNYIESATEIAINLAESDS